MSSTTLLTQHLESGRPQAIGEALRELSAAAQHLVQAVIGALPWRRRALSVGLTPAQEARRVRDLASTHLLTDPGFAADLFAAADRFERAQGL